ncbi:Sugar transferase involved in LPS biosynthesis (colanic, teichoic acid) [Ruminococcus sp. YE71]|uniref:sugar transferase n=1 Tax=unclassified Ruminococcus TaxID=2608920 RepID=UPI00088026B4|nr:MULTISPECIES: sugar transferase [unclassified Ruminococcus]SDA30675.1 Sugar transferase involved in LPS biosynthesis (colanic, teichoic acid) [Ruminococcus sp. YE78]SFW49907.1 Sugar transferase involved in LPS biosynthesis (colanic, teichoic acid) [Ruminococcus sp. YE71]
MTTVNAQIDTNVLTGNIDLLPFGEKSLSESKKAVPSNSIYRSKPAYEAVKRISDIVFSLLAITVLSPLMLVVMILIMVEDFGSPVYTQDRVGKDGKLFKIYKFRSMCKKADKKREELMDKDECNGATFKIKDDPRITKIGHIIRKTSIDELPQLINILKGEMSIVGPRPFIPREQARLPEDRLLVNPGLSCYWQVGGKNTLTKEQQIELDRKYIRERSVTVDIKIIIKTIFFVLRIGNS